MYTGQSGSRTQYAVIQKIPTSPPHDDFWQKVSGAVFLSRFSGGAPERYLSVGPVKEVEDWPSVNMMVRKADFLAIGGFDSPYWPGEDTKLCLDLKNLAYHTYEHHMTQKLSDFL